MQTSVHGSVTSAGAKRCEGEGSPLKFHRTTWLTVMCHRGENACCTLFSPLRVVCRALSRIPNKHVGKSC
eukprot:scaffold3107_cov73-Phaeocystis_antarctica.AAC.1